jgi:diacylglycerol kinase family enzyme
VTEPRHAADHPIVLLVNPRSTAAQPGLTEYAEHVLSPFGVRAVLTTQERGHAAELARFAMQEHEALTVVTLGGDGTAAEAAGALVGTGAALAPIPTGSTNVFARTIGWPMDPREAIDQLVRAIESGQRAESVTIGHVEASGQNRFFIVNAGVGIDAEAADLVERHPEWKRRVGQAWFASATFLAAARQRRQPLMRVSIDGGTSFPMASVSVACTRPYAYFRRYAFDLIPEAGQDGALGWLGSVSRGMSGPAIAAAGAFTGAWHLDSSRVAHGVARASIVLESTEGVALQADGEPLGRHRRIVMTPAAGLLVLRGDGRAR